MSTVIQEIDFIKNNVTKHWKIAGKILKRSNNLEIFANKLFKGVKTFYITAFSAPGIENLYFSFLEMLEKIQKLPGLIMGEYRKQALAMQKLEIGIKETDIFKCQEAENISDANFLQHIPYRTQKRNF